MTDVDEFLDSVTPEQMNRIEAQYLVRWQRESLDVKYQLASLLAAKGCEINWDAVEHLTPDWFPS